jgi:HEAT repeat protein
MTNWNEYAAYYIKQLRGPDSDDAYHSLIEADNAIIPILIGAFRAEQDSTIRSKLVKILWQHRLPEVTDFLSEATDDPAPEVWKSALDGLVAIGGQPAIQVLESARQHLQPGSRKERTRAKWIDEAIQQIRE